MSRKSFESFSPVKFRHRGKSTLSRITELSKPRMRVDAEDELVGPASYNPREKYLSTIIKSPSFAINRSERFINIKVKQLKKDLKSRQGDKEIAQIKYDPCEISSPKYTFKRTGHNLVLVNNPEFPGAGRYSPILTKATSAFSFPKAKKTFNWKKNRAHLVNRGWLF